VIEEFHYDPNRENGGAMIRTLRREVDTGIVHAATGPTNEQVLCGKDIKTVTSPSVDDDSKATCPDCRKILDAP
jgi:hypothetical protein